MVANEGSEPCDLELNDQNDILKSYSSLIPDRRDIGSRNMGPL